MTTVAIHQPQYLPWLPYFAKAASCDVFVYLDDVQFQKNGVQNRNQIKMANGPFWLTVPVRASLQNTIQQTPIDNTHAWSRKHLRSIDNSYAKASYKNFIETGMRQLLETEWTNIADLNIALTEWMFDKLDIRCKRVRSSELDIQDSKDDLVIAICQAVGAKVYLSGQGAKAYQDINKFRAKEIQLRYQRYELALYSQCWPNLGFLSGLSALDLILNVGEDAKRIMQLGMRPNE
jgi:WbqC-like protein family